MRRTVLLALVSILALAAPAGAHGVAAVGVARHHHPRRHHHRRHRRHRAPAATVARPVQTSPAGAPITPRSGATALAPPSVIGVGDPPGCLAGADPTPYLREYDASLLRIILSPYYGGPGTDGQAIPCLEQAIADGAQIEITIQWRSVWAPQQAADYVRQQLQTYAPYVSAVGLGNEQDLGWGMPDGSLDPTQTAAEYAADWQAAEPVVADLAPGATRIAVEAAPWSINFTQQAFAEGLPGAQALGAHEYATFGGPTVRDFYNLASRYSLPLWCDEGLSGPGAWVNPDAPPQAADQLAGCRIAVAWL